MLNRVRSIEASATGRACTIMALLVWLSVALPAQHRDSLRSNFYRDSAETSLAPDSAASSALLETIAAGLTELEPRIGIEIVAPVAVDPRAFTESGRLTLLRILQSVSTMAGIEYYSASRDEMRVFYHESYRVESAGDRARLDDPRPTRIPARETIFVYQRDGSFGRNVQRITYLTSDDAILMVTENVSTMSYNLIPLVAPGALRTYVLVQQDEASGHLVFYGNLGVHVPFLFGMEDRARASFLNRIVALQQWFVARLRDEGLAADES